MAESSDRSLRVFLCHASGDKPKVRELYKRLIADGIDAWLDEAKLLPGQNWREEIPRAVKNSDVVIVCLSTASVSKEGYVQREFKLALDIAKEKPSGTIFIIPLRLEECKLPGDLEDLHWVNLFGKGGYKKLLEALRLRAESLKVNEIDDQSDVADFEARDESKPIIPEPEVKPNQPTEKLPERKRSPGISNPTILAALIVAAATIIAALLSFEPLVRWFERTPIPTIPLTISSASAFVDAPAPTATITSSLTLTPTLNFIPLPTPTPTITATPTPLPERMIDTQGIAMALILAGEFTMGNNKGLSPEKPEHHVFLRNYYIDIYEVTNASYAACVVGGTCQKPVNNRSRTVSNYYADPDLANFPVVYVTWDMAKAYCSWRAGRLPTEAEWEKAARGTDQRLFPMGAGISCTRANYCKNDTTEVGRYKESPSPYGLFDMAGNVAEWVADWYGAGYYSASLPENPTGPASGQLRVVRGGSFESAENHDLQTTARAAQKPDAALDYVGFRCVREP